MSRFLTTVAACAALCAISTTARADAINVTAYSQAGLQVIDFEDVAGVGFPGVNYDGILMSGGAMLAERFVGQTLGFAGDNDVLSGGPSGPLTLQAGGAGQNLAVGTDNGTRNLLGCGVLTCVNANGYGEGAFAVLFAAPTAVFGFQQFFSNGGGAMTTLDFFNAGGGLIQRVTVDSSGSFNFAREGGVSDIAGVSVFTADAGGLAYDNLVYAATAAVPEPAAWALMLTGFALGGAALRRRRVSCPA